MAISDLSCWWSNWEDQSPTHLETGKIPEGFSHSSLTFNYYYTDSSIICQVFSFILFKSSIVTHHQLSNISYPHTEWIFFVPSKTESLAKGSISSHPKILSFLAQVRFNVDLLRIRSHSLHGVMMSSFGSLWPVHTESSFLITISSLTTLTISLVSSVIAIRLVPLLRNKVFIRYFTFISSFSLEVHGVKNLSSLTSTTIIQVHRLFVKSFIRFISFYLWGNVVGSVGKFVVVERDLGVR